MPALLSFSEAQIWTGLDTISLRQFVAHHALPRHARHRIPLRPVAVEVSAMVIKAWLTVGAQRRGAHSARTTCARRLRRTQPSEGC